MKYILCAVAVLWLQLRAGAQPSRIRFTSLAQAGVLRGGSTIDFQVQAIGGIAYRTYSAGIGAALDPYYFKSAPVFLDLRKHLLKKANTPFVYFDIGTNVPVNQSDSFSWQKSEFNAGLYYDAGLGYSWALHKKLKLKVSIGYSEKKQQELRQLLWRSDNITPEEYRYTFRRIGLKLGLGF